METPAMTQLNPPIPLDTPKGPAYAHLAIDYGQEHYLLFVCFLNDTGECWIFPNRDVKMQKNLSMGIRASKRDIDLDCGCEIGGTVPTGPLRERNGIR